MQTCKLCKQQVEDNSLWRESNGSWICKDGQSCSMTSAKKRVEEQGGWTCKSSDPDFIKGKIIASIKGTSNNDTMYLLIPK